MYILLIVLVIANALGDQERKERGGGRQGGRDRNVRLTHDVCTSRPLEHTRCTCRSLEHTRCTSRPLEHTRCTSRPLEHTRCTCRPIVQQLLYNNIPFSCGYNIAHMGFELKYVNPQQLHR